MRQRGKKCAWRACLPAMMLAAGTIPAGGGPEGWQLAFADDFERDVIGDDWKSIEGTWTIQDGWLRSAGTGEAVAPVRRRVSIAVPRDPAMAPNGSFERSAPGARPAVPANWLLARRPYDHTVELLSDPDLAHRGRCFLRLTNRGEYPLRVRTIPDWDHFSMQPGATYRIRVWARLAGESPATLIIEPGGDRFELTDEWAEHTVRYTHPEDAKRAALMAFAIEGGPADVDDALIVPQGSPEPLTAELAADWRGLQPVPAETAWRNVADEPAWKARIPVVIREVMGKEAVDYAVSLPVQELRREIGRALASEQ